MDNFWNKKKVLVTGAAGFIGSHVVDALVERGANVTAQVSNAKKDYPNLSKSQDKITITKGDLRNIGYVLKIIKNQDAVLNFAAMDGSSLFKSKHSAEIFYTNTQIVLNILEASRKNNVDRVLIISSTEIYEESTNSGYIQSKLFSELVAKLYYQEYGLKVSVARPSNTYGPRDSVDFDKGRVIPSFIKKSINKQKIEIWGSGRQEYSFLYVSDLVDGLLDLVEKYPNPDPVDIVSSYKISILKLARMILDLTNNDKKIVFKEVKKLPLKRTILSNKKAKKEIGFEEKIDLETGINRILEYLRER